MFKEQIEWLDVTDSTNNEAFRKLDAAPHGSVWAARFQTAGRGQKGNSWESAAGKNLMFSILLRPLFLPAERQFLISEIAALAVCDLLGSWEVEATIKWPNDIYVGNKKIQGMLIEHFLSGSQLSASIVGIGINLNQSAFASDAPNPTSVLIETGREYAVEPALIRLLDFLEVRYAALEKGQWEEIEAEYRQRIYRLNRWANYLNLTNNTPFDGRIIGVDEYGCLRVELRDGREATFGFKEIKYV